MEMMNGMNQFLEEYANWSQLRTICLTFDIDFVPDFMLEHLLDILDPCDVSVTFFVTHSTPILDRIRKNPKYEMAFHPFNNPTSTQGSGFEDIIAKLRQIVPESVGNRFHRLEHSYRDLLWLGQTGCLYDASTIRHNTPYLLPAWHNDMKMVLLTTIWEDGSNEGMGYPMRIDSINLDSPGLKILAFHPLNAYLNSKDPRARMDFLSKIGNLSNCTQETAKEFCGGEGEGSRGVLREVLELIKRRSLQTVTAQRLTEAFKAAIAQ